LVFLAADKTRLQDLDDATRRYLAWESVLAEKLTLNLDPQQVKQAENQMTAADSAVTARLPETYKWLLVPGQATPQAPVEWQVVPISGQDALAVRASKKLKGDELLLTGFAATRLRMELEKVPLWRGDSVAVKQLIEDFGKYLYLPRLKNSAVLIGAVREGVSLLTWEQDGFAFADSHDEAAGRYRGLRAGQVVSLADGDAAGLLVKPDVARRQIEAETPKPSTGTPASESEGGEGTDEDPTDEKPPVATRPKRFHGTVTLDPTRVGRDSSRIAEEVIAHLVGLVGSTVVVTLEIEADIPTGAPDNVVRTVTENSRTLKFTQQGFEKE